MREQPNDGFRLRTASRRAFLAGSGIAITGCTAPTRPVQSRNRESNSSGEKADWTSFGQDAQNTRSRSEATSRVSDPERVWRAPLDGNIWSAPTATGSMVFSTGDNRIFAFDRSSGKPRWVTSTKGKTGYFTPTVAGDTVFTGVQGDQSTRLLALDASSGKRIWEREKPFSSYANVASGTVYVETTQEGTRTVWALDAATGEEKWHASAPVTTSGRVSPAPAIADGNVYFTTTANNHIHLYALNATTGERRWHRTTEGRSEMAPVVHERTVCFGNERGAVHAYDVESGDERWRAETDASIRGNPVLTDGHAYVGDVMGELYAFARASGELKWTAETQLVNSTPALVGDQIHTGGTALVCLDRKSGEQEWDFNVPTHSSSFFSPTPAGEAIFAGVCIKHNSEDPYDNYIYRIG